MTSNFAASIKTTGADSSSAARWRYRVEAGGGGRQRVRLGQLAGEDDAEAEAAADAVDAGVDFALRSDVTAECRLTTGKQC